MTPKEVAWGIFAILVGAAVIYAGDRLMGISLELFYGVQTFNPLWIVTLFFVPFVAGVVVSLIFGLGGKILAYFSPIIVRAYEYNVLYDDRLSLPDGVTLLPIGFWILIVILAVEAAAIGGVIGEIINKKVYGRTAKSKFHKRFQKKQNDLSEKV
ncbi:MAG: hypothetical protein COB71_01715 [Thiotrichales bacterium]|nr:MAG: hypothetical protein COB71_01715 [Thiotrichales bacterium]